ncbi:GLPGLI family protein [Marinifilum sp.]|uniref:GLPGLI family protein n=1 Tax=Marinifilum sp. TaxID=2033137 RepID=UPI003BAC89D0
MKAGKVITLLLVLITISGSLYAQEKELVINYNYKLNGSSVLHNENSFGPHGKIQTIAYGNKLISRQLWGTMPTYDESGNELDQDTLYYYVVHDYTQNQILTSTSHGMNVIVLKESLDLFAWELEEQTKTILNYPCHKATCTFRGRDYEAWFTLELPFKAAPWKFHGLPGVVLEVYSTDGFCSWTAQSLEIKPHSKEIELPLDNAEIFNLEQHKKYIEKMKQQRLEMHKKRKIIDNGIQIPKKFAKAMEYQIPETIEKFDLD